MDVGFFNPQRRRPPHNMLAQQNWSRTNCYHIFESHGRGYGDMRYLPAECFSHKSYVVPQD